MTENYVKPLQALRAVMVEKRRKLAEFSFAFPQRRESCKALEKAHQIAEGN